MYERKKRNRFRISPSVDLSACVSLCSVSRLKLPFQFFSVFLGLLRAGFYSLLPASQIRRTLAYFNSFLGSKQSLINRELMFWSATKIQETLKAENELGSFQLVTGCGQGQANKQNRVHCKQVVPYWYARGFLHLHYVPTELVVSQEELSAAQSLNQLHPFQRAESLHQYLPIIRISVAPETVGFTFVLINCRGSKVCCVCEVQVETEAVGCVSEHLIKKIRSLQIT